MIYPSRSICIQVHLSSSSKDINNPSMTHPSTQYILPTYSNCLSKSNQEVFNVGGSSKSSRLESRKRINKLPVSCRKCVDKLPLNISSPLSYAREKLDTYSLRSLWC
ncbi:hypothetical protein Hanom_Chr01g00091261 [Helianthus anomalus]